MTSSSQPIVDVHTHMYPPSYMSLLSSRTTVPYIHTPTTGDPRLIILPSDDDPSKPLDQRGRPVDSSYSSFDSKLAFMRTHGITHSIISLANPWLDFLPTDTAAETADMINSDLDAECARLSENGGTIIITSTTTTSTDPGRQQQRQPKLYAFASLPLSAPLPSVLSSISHLKTLPHTRGVIMGTSGLGSGLDDPLLNPIYSALSSSSTPIFLHPHYGLPTSVFGPSASSYGHTLPLALGFPLETTIAITRVYLSGVFDRYPDIVFLLAHSGGTLPFLAGRIESCVAHEREFDVNGGSNPAPKRSLWEVLRTNIYLDAVVYGEPGLRAAIEAVGGGEGEEAVGGWDRLMFGTDHPFFPPLGGEGEDGTEEQKWLSVQSNLKAIDAVCKGHEDRKWKILGGNAVKVFGLEV